VRRSGARVHSHKTQSPPAPKSLHGLKSVHVLFLKQLKNGMGKQYKMTMGFFENVKACIGRQLHFRKALWLFTSGNALTRYNKRSRYQRGAGLAWPKNTTPTMECNFSLLGLPLVSERTCST